LEVAEVQMRKALGLEGTTLRLPLDLEPQWGEQGHRPAERGAFSGHRRRFVRDGDVPVTVRRRDPVAEPGRSRLQQAEAQVAAEAAARTQAERALAEAQVQARDLQTKLGHAELAKNEALEAVRRNRETIAELESEVAQQAAFLREAEERALQAEQAKTDLQASFEKERAARKAAEKTLRLAEEARDTAERLVRELSKASPARRGQGAKAVVEPEPEPIKWWLAPAPTGTRSRRC